MRTSKAIRAKRVIGELTDYELLRFIGNYEGLTLYEIAKKKAWSIGKVQGSLKRLLKRGAVYSKKKGKKRHYFLAGFPEVPEYIG